MASLVAAAETPGGRSPFATGAIVAVLVVAASVGSVAAALANVAYFNLIDGIVGAREEIPRALIFSSWLVILSLPFVAWRPRTFGLTVGRSLSDWPIVVAAMAVGALFTALLLMVVGSTPYSDASAFVEIVLVPVTEEVLFRGVLLVLMVGALRSVLPSRSAIVVAVVGNGMAFGLGHAANALSVDPMFVAQQVAFASVLGTACAALAVRTRSIYPAILLHATINAVVVLV